MIQTLLRLDEIFEKDMRYSPTSEDLCQAYTKSLLYKDRPSQQRQPAAKVVDALMECAETAVCAQEGFTKASGFDDVIAGPSAPIQGIVEIKTKEPSVESSAIKSQQSYQYMLVLDRMFDKGDIVKLVEGDDINALLNVTLVFRAVEILKFDNGCRKAFWKRK